MDLMLLMLFLFCLFLSLVCLLWGRFDIDWFFFFQEHCVVKQHIVLLYRVQVQSVVLSLYRFKVLLYRVQVQSVVLSHTGSKCCSIAYRFKVLLLSRTGSKCCSIAYRFSKVLFYRVQVQSVVLSRPGSKCCSIAYRFKVLFLSLTGSKCCSVAYRFKRRREWVAGASLWRHTDSRQLCSGSRRLYSRADESEQVFVLADDRADGGNPLPPQLPAVPPPPPHARTEPSRDEVLSSKHYC